MPRIAAYGTVDELNALVGLVVAGDCPDEIRLVLLRVQNELFDLGADLSVPMEHDARLRVTQEQVDTLESDCDRFNAAAAGAQELRPSGRDRGCCAAPCRTDRLQDEPSAKRSSQPAQTR